MKLSGLSKWGSGLVSSRSAIIHLELHSEKGEKKNRFFGRKPMEATFDESEAVS